MAVYDEEKEKTKENTGQHDDLGVHPEHREAEVDDLERNFNAPSSPDGTDPAVSADKLKTAEEEGATSTSSEEEPNFEYRDDDAGKTKGKTGFRAKFFGSKRKKILFAAGSFGGMGFIALIVVFLLFLSSLKYVHFATVLRSYAFARFNLDMRQEYSQDIFDTAVLSPDSTGSFSRDLAGDRSIFDLVRGINPAKQLEELGKNGQIEFDFQQNRSWLGRTSNSFEGVSIRQPDGSLRDYSLDGYANKIGNGDLTYSDLNIFQRLQVRKELSADIRADLSDNLGLQGRDLIASLKGISRAFGFDLIGFKNWARNLTGKKTADIQAEVESEAYGDVQGTQTGVESSDSNTSDNASKERAKIDENIKAGDPTPEAGVNVSGASNKINTVAEGAKDVSTAVFITTSYCIARDLVGSIDKIDQTNQGHSVRQAANTNSRADQIRAGDVQAPLVGAAAQSFDGADASTLYAQDTGGQLPQDQTDVGAVTPLDLTNTLKPFTKAFHTVDDAISVAPAGVLSLPFVGHFVKHIQNRFKDAACKIVLNPATQISIAAAETILSISTGGEESVASTSLIEGFKSGLEALGTKEGAIQGIKAGGKFAATYALFDAAGRGLDGLIKQFSGEGVSGVATGTDLYNQNHVGDSYLSAMGSRQTTYGKPISPGEAGQANAVAFADMRDQYSQQPFAKRYFAVDNPFSLIGNLAAAVPTNFGTIVQSAVAKPLSIISNIGSVFSSFGKVLTSFAMLNPKVMAASSVDVANKFFGVQQYGWSQSDLNTIQTDPSYSLVTNSNYVESKYTELKKEFGHCYDSIDPSKENTIQDGCSEQDLSSPDALHWRKYMWDKYIAQQLSTDLSPTQ